MTTIVAASIGGVIGSVLTAVANFLLQRQQDERRWRREDRVSMRRDRLRIYREIITILELAKDGRSPYGEEPFAIHEGAMPLVAEMKLIAPDNVVRAAEDALSAAQYHEHLWMKNEHGQKVHDAAMQLEQRTDEFIQNVREELGFSEGDPEPELTITRQTTEPNEPKS